MNQTLTEFSQPATLAAVVYLIVHLNRNSTDRLQKLEERLTRLEEKIIKCLTVEKE